MMWGLMGMVAAAPLTQVWLGGALSGTVAPAKAVGTGTGLMGEVGVALGRDPRHSFGMQARVREMYVSEELRSVGAIDLQLRYPSGIGPYIGLGFSHHHEAPMNLYLAHPLQVSTGIDPDLIHRTGFEVASGWSFATIWPDQGFPERLSPFLETSVAILPDQRTPSVYVFLDFGIHLGVGRVLK